MEIFLPFFIMFCLFIIDVYVGSFFLLSYPLKVRFKPYIAIPIGILVPFIVSTILSLLLQFLPNIFVWNELFNILFYTILSFSIYFSFLLMFEIDYKRLVLIVTISHTFQHITYHISLLLMSTGLIQVLSNFMDASIANILLNIIYYIIKGGLYVGFYFFVARNFTKYRRSYLNKWDILVIVLISCFIIDIANVFISQHYQEDILEHAMMSIAQIIFCATFDAMIIVFLRIDEKKIDANIIEATSKAKVKQFELMENNLNYVNIKFHDLRKELRRLKEHKENLKDEDFTLLEHSLRLFDNEVDSGSDNIDALIQDKLIYCKSVGIDFTPLVDAKALDMMDESDVYFLLMNIIDNAIEAVEKCDKEEEKVISLMINKKQGTTVIEQTNYFKGELDFDNDGSLKTTKVDKRFHGFGTKSINYIVKKYNGRIHYGNSKNIFSLKIVI